MENEIVKIIKMDEEHFATELDCSIDDLLNVISILGKEVSEFFVDKGFTKEQIENLLTRIVVDRLPEGE